MKMMLLLSAVGAITVMHFSRKQKFFIV